MKTRLLFLIAVVSIACGQIQKNDTSEQVLLSDGVEVLSFHTKQRCSTCVAVEQLTREVIEEDFAAQIADSSLVFRVVDISENEALADKYEVTWSSLFVNRHKDGAVSVNDLTKVAFANARANPGKFKAELKAQIEKLINE